ncbi:MAG: NADPH-dependent assimilatory sulfite reductase hemoprotein subunit, partial [Phycisphaeraceae bacterium]|nr:NADPH-dependent assimilatory sulfite reductase hemoprotein subunit [Phycisphaeraceae bacterium]
MAEKKRLKINHNKDKPTKVEKAKSSSKYLYGTIQDVLEGEQEKFDHDDVQALKFHGIYQQDDRDTRDANKAFDGGRDYSFMIRAKIPGGTLTAEQYLAMDEVAQRFTHNDSLRITTRQAFQFHGVLKGTLKGLIQGINDTLLSTLAGCGDVERNVMASPAPLTRPVHAAARGFANEIADALCPQTNAYYDIWLNGEKQHTSTEGEPLYGDAYLPRKFKTGIALPDDNAADVCSQDVGLIAVPEGDDIRAVNVMVGGGLGMTHKKPETFARLGTRLGSVAPADVVDTVRTICEIFRDFGDRTDRRHARLKYILEDQGIEAFRNEFEARTDFELGEWIECGELEHQDWLGRHEQGDGKFFYGIYVENGRIIDRESRRQKTALRKIVQELQPSVILTPNQNIIFGGLSEEDVEQLERVLDAYHVPKVEELSEVRRGAMACPALPTCGLALTESERIMPDVVDELEAAFAELGIDDTPLTVRMTGCPNGCARPYTADIGLVGHKPGPYDLFLGGRRHGDRMAEFFLE